MLLFARACERLSLIYHIRMYRILFKMVSACEFISLSEHHYAFQHVKAYGFLNLLVGDPWHTDAAYFVDKRWKVMKFSAAIVSQL